MLRCRICRVEYEKQISRLDQEVDIYCSWIDECEKANANPAGDQDQEVTGLGLQSAVRSQPRQSKVANQRQKRRDDDDEDEYGEEEDIDSNEERSVDDVRVEEESEEIEEIVVPKKSVGHSSHKRELKQKEKEAQKVVMKRLRRNDDDDHNPEGGKQITTTPSSQKVGKTLSNKRFHSTSAYIDDGEQDEEPAKVTAGREKDSDEDSEVENFF